MAFRIFLLLCAFTSLVGSLARAQAPENESRRILSIEQLRNLSPEEASQKFEIEIEAQITLVSPTREGLYLHDGELGCYVTLKTAEAQTIPQRPGQRVLVKGYTNADSYLPHIEALSIEPRGDAPLPLPASLDQEMLTRPAAEYSWVKAGGKVLQGRFDEQSFIITIESMGEKIDLHLPNTLESSMLSNSLFEAEIEIRGVLITEYGPERELLKRHIGLPSAQFIRMTSEDRKKEVPSVTVAEITLADSPHIGAVRVRGTITYRDDSRIVMQENGRGLMVLTTTPCPYERGDEVEAIGLVATDIISHILKAQSFELIDNAELPEPTRIDDLGKIDREALNNTLIVLTAEVLEKKSAVNGSIISASANGKVFPVGLPVSWTEMRTISAHSTVDIVGIYQNSVSTSPLNPIDPDAFQLLVMTTEDVNTLKKRGWWNLRRFLAVLGLIGLILAVALGWVWLLRRKVSEQTATISAKVAQESSAKERERVARELHDSLEQNLAAVALHIQNCILFYSKEKYELLGPALDLTKKMAKACQRESREAIYDLRGTDEESAAWRDEMLLSEAERQGAEIKLKITGKSYSLEADAKRQLRRIVREATYNSLRHGAASEVIVEYDYTPDLFTAKVHDNGKGFDVNGPRPEGHFGLAGMEERAGRIGANFLLESELGSGTTVSIRLPVNKNKSSG